MKILTLDRITKADSDNGRFGVVITEEKGILVTTVELPWKDNQNGISCIPKGEYIIQRKTSEHFGYELFEILNVPNRTACEIHKGNTIRDIHGCIAVGQGYGNLMGLPSIMNSGLAFQAFMDYLKGENQATLVIEEV